VRGLLHFGVLASLTLSFGLSPFAHRHSGDPEHAHAGGEIHSHWLEDADHAEPDGSGWEAYDGDGDAQDADWLAGDGKSPVVVLYVPEESIVVAEPEGEEYLSADLTPRNHGPPGLLQLQPRAPPV
jgi:hypothetical protein